MQASKRKVAGAQQGVGASEATLRFVLKHKRESHGRSLITSKKHDTRGRPGGLFRAPKR